MRSSPELPKRFAPLDASITKNVERSGARMLKGVVFDVDGTLCEPQTYMFGEMRSALGIDKSIDILEHVYSLQEPEAEAAMAKIRAIESKAMSAQTPQPGLLKLMDYLDGRGIPKGICTRNFDAPVTHLIDTFLEGHLFRPIVTREFRPPKPDPAGILHIARTWGLDSGEDLIMVGDSIDDMTAGFRAGAATVLLVNDVNTHLAMHEHTDLCIKRLDDLINILENGFEGRIDRLESASNTRHRAENVQAKGISENSS